MFFLYFLFGSLILSLLLFVLLRAFLKQVGHYKTNYRQQPVLQSIGILYLFNLLICGVVFSLFLPDKFWQSLESLYLNLLILILGMGFLGLLDDFFGKTGKGGFRGHLGALLKGEITTGFLKAIFGFLLSLFVAARLVGSLNWQSLIVDALVISLTINVFNLFDLRPGRALKLFFFIFILAFLFSYHHHFWLIGAISLGASLIILPSDLSEQTMLGDVGSNTLGAVIGLGLAVLLSYNAKLFLLVLLIVFHLITEKHSLTEFIERVPLLRWFDQLGRH